MKEHCQLRCLKCAGALHKGIQDATRELQGRYPLFFDYVINLEELLYHPGRNDYKIIH